jgi:hypothetical protein
MASENIDARSLPGRGSHSPSSQRDETHRRNDRRHFLGTGLAAGVGLAVAAAAAGQSRTTAGPDTLNGQPMPEPSPEQSAGPVKAGRGSMPRQPEGRGRRS